MPLSADICEPLRAVSECSPLPWRVSFLCGQCARPSTHSPDALSERFYPHCLHITTGKVLLAPSTGSSSTQPNSAVAISHSCDAIGLEWDTWLLDFFSHVPNLEATADAHEKPAEALDLED